VTRTNLRADLVAPWRLMAQACRDNAADSNYTGQRKTAYRAAQRAAAATYDECANYLEEALKR
jgi:hypothetical protein